MQYGSKVPGEKKADTFLLKGELKPDSTMVPVSRYGIRKEEQQFFTPHLILLKNCWKLGMVAGERDSVFYTWWNIAAILALQLVSATVYILSYFYWFDFIPLLFQWSEYLLTFFIYLFIICQKQTTKLPLQGRLKYCCNVLYLFTERERKTGCGYPLFVKCSTQEIGMSGQWLLVRRRAEAASKPRSEHVPKRVSSFRRSESPSSLQDMDGTDFGGSSGSYSFNHGPPPSYSQAGMHAACGVSLLALSLALWVSFLFLFFVLFLNTLFSFVFFVFNLVLFVLSLVPPFLFSFKKRKMNLRVWAKLDLN